MTASTKRSASAAHRPGLAKLRSYTEKRIRSYVFLQRSGKTPELNRNVMSELINKTVET